MNVLLKDESTIMRYAIQLQPGQSLVRIPYAYKGFIPTTDLNNRSGKALIDLEDGEIVHRLPERIDSSGKLLAPEGWLVQPKDGPHMNMIGLSRHIGMSLDWTRSLAERGGLSIFGGITPYVSKDDTAGYMPRIDRTKKELLFYRQDADAWLTAYRQKKQRGGQDETDH